MGKQKWQVRVLKSLELEKKKITQEHNMFLVSGRVRVQCQVSVPSLYCVSFL